MKLLIFWLVYPLVWLFSKLPMRAFYLISDVLFFITYYLIGYRKDVVFNNISVAFPEKSTAEKKLIEKEFFKHFADILVESVKGLTMGKDEILKRYQYKNPELLNSFAGKGRSIALVGSHKANWEWMLNLPLVSEIDVFAAYKTIRNPHFDKNLKKTRERFGGKSIVAKEIVREIFSNFKKNQHGVYILLSDQSPTIQKTFYWTEFFGVKVPVHNGLETLAKKFDLVVINFNTKKIKRGYYETEFQLITDAPKELKNNEIIEKYLRLTEKNIRENPPYYLWSHKRFKHKDRFEEWQQLNVSKKTKS